MASTEDAIRVVTLIENSPGEGCLCEHGLSLYIETPRSRLLFDTGASDGFLRNANRLGIDLTSVDAVILSHGHYDHGNGIPFLAGIHPAVRIYMQRTAALEYFALEEPEPRYIGIPREIMCLPNVIPLDGSAALDEELFILAGFPGRRRWSRSNLRLKRRSGDSLQQDCFDHEQALVVRLRDRYCLFSGCAHNGILNILDRFRAVYDCDPAVVVSGFHFMKQGAYTPEEAEDITVTAEELARMDTVFYTGHCTSLPAYELMKPIMGEQLQALYSGREILVPTSG